MLISETIWCKLKNALAYTGIESSLYQAALFSHQYLLYNYVGAHIYGYFGTIFSLIYLSSLYLNMGLDLTIAPLFNQRRNDSRFIKSILLQILYNGVFGVIAFFTMGIFLKDYFNLSLIELGICGLIVLSETAKKSLKTIVHLLFLHRFVTITELISLSTYIAIVWSLLLSGYNVSLFSILVPLLITSLSALAAYFWYVWLWLSKLPIESTPLAIEKIITLRAHNYLYQITHSLYSPNFIIPIIAMQYNMELASLLKIISMGVYAINNIIQHIFGITSAVLFCHMKEYEKKDKHLILQTLHRYIIKVAIAVAIYSILNYYILCEINPKEHFYIVYLFILIICSEHLMLAYEQFFIIEEQTTFLSISNTSLFLLIIISKNIVHASIESLLLVILICRSMHFLTIYLYGNYYLEGAYCRFKKTVLY